jgi:3-hydroxyisobutyrate dehydrogenase-like beta-hydroxyacid dehydrogenase
VKDVTYAVEEGNTRGVEMATALAALKVFRQALAKGYGEQDFTAVVQAQNPTADR